MIHLLGHGVGGRSDLPLEVWQFAYAAGVALAISFVALRVLWPRPRLAAAAAGRPAPRWMPALVGPLGLVLEVVVMAVYLITLAAAWVGVNDQPSNLAPVALYVAFWVGVQAASAVFGGFWDRVDPVARIAEAIFGNRPRRTAAGLAATHWPAAAVLVVFHWLELAYHDQSAPRAVAVFLTAHLLFVLAGCFRYGASWARDGDGFAVLFRFLAALSPLARRDDGTLGLRIPGSGLATLEFRPGSLAIIVVVLGGTGFDGVGRTTFWRDMVGTATGWERTVRNTVGLTLTICTVAVVFLVGTRLVDRFAGDDEDLVHARRWAQSLVPIALGYAVAHYFSLFVFEGQGFLALISDPFGEGWNLLGTADWRINYRLVTLNQIAWVQVLGIVVGHVAGVIVAHDRAVELYDERTAVRSQYPMLVVMIAYTVGGLYLLLNA